MIYQVKGINGHQWVCVECVQVCESVREYVRGCVQVWEGVHGYAQVYVDMHGCGVYFQNFFWRIESLYQRTLICFLYFLYYDFYSANFA